MGAQVLIAGLLQTCANRIVNGVGAQVLIAGWLQTCANRIVNDVVVWVHRC